ncbi:MAG: pyruvate kinase [Phycisphaerales bacterium]
MGTPRPTLATIIATLGPASDAPEVVLRLIEAGVGVFRLNLSHGTEADHARRVEVVRGAAEAAELPIAVLGDLPGPKIRIGACPEAGVELEAGQDVLIDPDLGCSIAGATARLSCTLGSIGSDVQPGQKVLINDGAVRLLAIDRLPDDPARALRARVVTGGLVTSKKGLNLPQSELHVSAMSERDWKLVEWAVGAGVDYLAMSFVRSAVEIGEVKARLETMCSTQRGATDEGGSAAIPVVAKIETPQAVARMREIVGAADAIMVARGDLGVEMDIAQVPLIQKELIRTAASYGKPCIVATQMLETMCAAPLPTRAEASDVANAILDGADAVMLSGETAVGKHPVLVVETMRRIVMAAEERMAARLLMRPSPPAEVIQTGYRTAALAHGAWYVARDVGARLVVCWSQSGGLARYLSQMGFAVPVVAYSSSAVQTRRMALLRGVTPVCEAPPADARLSSWNKSVDAMLIARGWANKGDAVVLIAGRPLGKSKPTNTLAVHYVGEESAGFMAH